MSKGHGWTAITPQMMEGQTYGPKNRGITKCLLLNSHIKILNLQFIQCFAQLRWRQTTKTSEFPTRPEAAYPGNRLMGWKHFSLQGKTKLPFTRFRNWKPWIRTVALETFNISVFMPLVKFFMLCLHQYHGLTAMTTEQHLSSARMESWKHAMF